MHDLRRGGMFIVLASLLVTAVTVWGQTDTVHTTVYAAVNLTVSDIDTVPGPQALGSSVVIDSSNTASIVYRSYDTVSIVDTLSITAGEAVIAGKVICRSLISSGGILTLGTDDSLEIWGEPNFAGLANDTIGGTVRMKARTTGGSPKDLYVKFGHGNKTFTNLTLWSNLVGSDVGRINLGEGVLRVTGNLFLEWNRGPSGSNSMWVFEKIDTVYVGGNIQLNTVGTVGGGNSAWYRMGPTVWVLSGQSINWNSFGAQAQLIMTGDSATTQTLTAFNGTFNVQSITHTGAGTVKFIYTNNAKSFVTGSLIQSAGTFDMGSVDTLSVNDLTFTGGDFVNEAGKVLTVRGSAKLLGTSADTTLNVIFDSTFTINARSVLQARYITLKNCIASTGNGIAYMSADSGNNVNWTFIDSDRPVIGVEPKNITATVGDTATFKVAAAGFGTLQYQWYRNDTAIDGATLSSLTLATTMADSGATFQVIVTDSASAAADTSVLCTLSVIDPPRVTGGTSSTQKKYVGESITVEVAAAGADTLQYQWLKAGTAIDGATSAALTIDSLTRGDAGKYRCVVTSSSASYAAISDTSKEFSLEVRFPVTILAQPQSIDIPLDSAATLSISLSTEAAVTFQWQKDKKNIDGATDSVLSIAKMTAEDAGDYVCVITNEGVTTKSSTAKLGTREPNSVINGISTTVPRSLVLAGSPNPVRTAGATVKFGVPSAADVSLGMYAYNGRLVCWLVAPGTHLNPGYYAVRWERNSKQVAPGRYLYRLKAGKKVLDQSVVIMH